MQEYRSVRAVNIHYPPSQYLDDSARSSLFQDLPGLRLGRTIQLVKADAAQDRMHAALGPRHTRLTLKIHNKVRVMQTQISPSTLATQHSGCDRSLPGLCWEGF